MGKYLISRFENKRLLHTIRVTKERKLKTFETSDDTKITSISKVKINNQHLKII